MSITALIKIARLGLQPITRGAVQVSGKLRPSYLRTANKSTEIIDIPYVDVTKKATTLATKTTFAKVKDWFWWGVSTIAGSTVLDWAVSEVSGQTTKTVNPTNFVQDVSKESGLPYSTLLKHFQFGTLIEQLHSILDGIDSKTAVCFCAWLYDEAKVRTLQTSPELLAITTYARIRAIFGDIKSPDVQNIVKAIWSKDAPTAAKSALLNAAGVHLGIGYASFAAFTFLIYYSGDVAAELNDCSNECIYDDVDATIYDMISSGADLDEYKETSIASAYLLNVTGMLVTWRLRIPLSRALAKDRKSVV